MWDEEAGVGQGAADGDGEEGVLYDEEDGEVVGSQEEREESGCWGEVGGRGREV